MCVKLKVNLFSYFLSIVALIGCILFAGCSHILSDRDKYTNTVPQDKLQQIDTLELTEDKNVQEEKTVTELEEINAPAQLELSLEECRALALENNLDLKVKLIDPAISAESITEAEAKFEATFTVNATYRQSNSPVAGYETEVSGSETKYTYVNYGINLPMKTGGDIDVGIVDYRTKTNAIGSLNPRYSPSFTASITQPLLRGAGKRASMYTIRAAEYNSQITSAQTKSEVIRIISEIDKAYWKLYAERKQLDVLRQEYDLAKDWTKQKKRLVEVGMDPEIDLIYAQVSEATSLENIIKAENRVSDMERDLKLKLNKPGLGAETGTELILTTEPDPVQYKFSKEQTVKKALENRMDMLQLELELAKDDNTIAYNRNQLRPDVELKYEYGINGLGASRHDGYDMLIDNEYKNHTVTLGVTVPLENKAAKSRLRMAQYERSQRLINRDKKKAEIEYEVLGDIDQLEAGWQSILATQKSTIYRDKQYRAEKREYELGMQTLRDVLVAQKELTNAQKNEITALTNYQISLIDLAASTGTLLGAAKVDLVPIKK